MSERTDMDSLAAATIATLELRGPDADALRLLAQTAFKLGQIAGTRETRDEFQKRFRGRTMPNSPDERGDHGMAP